MLEKLSGLLKQEKLRKIIIICGVLAMLLILLSSFTDLGTSSSAQSTVSVEDYKEEMQDSLKYILTKIDGVGEVEVFLTVDSSTEGVYLDNNSTKTKDIEPVIRGVVVVCQGGDSPVVSQQVLDAVTKSLNISSAKVCISKLSE